VTSHEEPRQESRGADEDKRQFAAALREAMAARGMRVGTLARELRKSEAAVAKWRGASAWPRSADLPRLCHALALEESDPLARRLYEARGLVPGLSISGGLSGMGTARSTESKPRFEPSRLTSPRNSRGNLDKAFVEWVEARGLPYAVFPEKDPDASQGRRYLLPSLGQHVLHVTISEPGQLRIQVPMGFLPKQPQQRARVLEFLVGANYENSGLPAKTAVDLKDGEILLESSTMGLIGDRGSSDTLQGVFGYQLVACVRQARDLQIALGALLHCRTASPSEILDSLGTDRSELDDDAATYESFHEGTEDIDVRQGRYEAALGGVGAR
jgi:hypothetical protein